MTFYGWSLSILLSYCTLFFCIIARGAHANESPKSHRTRPTHSSHSPAKAQTHTDTSGKTVTHGKTGAHGTTKKSGTSKSPAKNNKTEQVKSDSKKNNHIGIVIFFSVKNDLTYYINNWKKFTR